MAERRMFAKSIIFNDHFGNLPLQAQLLYFNLSLEGDDDGAAIAGVTAETAKELAAAGAGVVLLPQIYAEKELSEGKLFVLPVAPPENPAKTLYVSINPKSEKEKLVSAFLSIAGMNRSCGE